MPMAPTAITRFGVLLAGGSGTRLWPVSRELYPKQLVNFLGADSLVQSTIKRIGPLVDPNGLRIVCGQEHRHEIARHIEEVSLCPADCLLVEPCGRNTAPAVLLAVLTILAGRADALVGVFPADHVIRDAAGFQRQVQTAFALAREGAIVTFGIRPAYPETGYGYIEGAEPVAHGGLRIRRFVEKPDRQNAEKYLQAGNFFWNSGMFAFRASVMQNEFARHKPALLHGLTAGLANAAGLTRQAYAGLENISFDHAIMEKTDKGVVLPSDFGWSDIGTWKSLYDFSRKDAGANVLEGDVITRETTGCLIKGHRRLIAVNHMQNTVVVETPDAVFVSDMEHSRDVKAIVADLKARGRQEYHHHGTIHYPWGRVTALEHEQQRTVDRLVVYPGAGLDVGAPAGGCVHLVAVEGRAGLVHAGGRSVIEAGQSVQVPPATALRLENNETADLVVIQVRIAPNG
jgi:mannose-1-phosphate guanylyltransferase/mannose-6-phosphate isomerase